MWKVYAWAHHCMRVEINGTMWLHDDTNARACAGNVAVPTRQLKHYAWCIDASAGSISHYDDAQLHFAHSAAFVVHWSLYPWYAAGCYLVYASSRFSIYTSTWSGILIFWFHCTSVSRAQHFCRNSLFLGADLGNIGRDISGRMFCIQIFDKLLSQAEVQQAMQSCVRGKVSACLYLDLLDFLILV